jgi:hypothetical protein
MLVLLRPADRDHLGLALAGSLLQQRAHHVDLPHAVLELDQRDVVVLGEPGYRLPEPGADLLQHRRGGDLHPQMRVQEPDDLPARLKRGNIAIEVHPVQALDVQHRVTVQQLRDCNDMRHDDRPE